MRFEVALAASPVFSGYCHCRDCRQAHASALYQYAYLHDADVSLKAAAASTSWFTRSQSDRNQFERHFCLRCGTRVFNRLRTNIEGKERTLIGLFPALMDPHVRLNDDDWRPRQHIYCGEAGIDVAKINDGLPKYAGDVGTERLG